MGFDKAKKTASLYVRDRQLELTERGQARRQLVRDF